MAETGWKIKVEKSSILMSEVLFLEFIISADGVCADPKCVKVYAEWELRRFNPLDIRNMTNAT